MADISRVTSYLLDLGQQSPSLLLDCLIAVEALFIAFRGTLRALVPRVEEAFLLLLLNPVPALRQAGARALCSVAAATAGKDDRWAPLCLGRDFSASFCCSDRPLFGLRLFYHLLLFPFFLIRPYHLFSFASPALQLALSPPISISTSPWLTLRRKQPATVLCDQAVAAPPRPLASSPLFGPSLAPSSRPVCSPPSLS